MRADGIKHIMDGISKFLSEVNGKELLIFFAFIAVAALFWSIQTLQDDFEVEYRFAISLQNMPQSAVVTSDLSGDILVKVKDKGAMLFNAASRKNIVRRIEINFEDFKAEKGRFYVPPAYLIEAMKKQLPITNQIIGLFPDHLNLFFTTAQAKEVEVRLDAKFKPAVNCIISGEISYKPSTVRVLAPVDMLDSINQVSTAYLFAENLKDTFRTTVQFEKIQGVKFQPEQVEVVVPIEEFTEKTISVPITATNLPSNLRLRSFPSKANISFFVGLSHFSHAADSSFAVGADCGFLADQPNAKRLPLNLLKYPDYARNIRINPDSVEFILEEHYTYD